MRGGIRGLLINFLQGAAVCRAEAMPAFRAPAGADSRTTSKLLGTRGVGLIPVLLLRYLSSPPFQPFPCWLTAHPHKMRLFKDGKCQAWFSEPFFFTARTCQSSSGLSRAFPTWCCPSSSHRVTQTEPGLFNPWKAPQGPWQNSFFGGCEHCLLTPFNLGQLLFWLQV